MKHAIQHPLRIPDFESVGDEWMVRESGSGMDAPGEIPAGSVISLFVQYSDGEIIDYGITQRTTPRP